MHAFPALWRDKANDELIAVHVRTFNLEVMHFMVRIPPLAFSLNRLAPLELRQTGPLFPTVTQNGAHQPRGTERTAPEINA